jgi:tetratricopeptide (TPR) repeat protein
MKKFTTVEGHALIAMSDPKGVQIVAIPAEASVEDGETVADVFTLGINFSHLVRSLREMDTPAGFMGEGWDCSFRRTSRKISFRFAYQHDPSRTFETKLSEADSTELVQFLERSVQGEALPGIPENGSTLVSAKTGRNAPCPCGSGKKYKKCCGLLEKTGGLPPGLDSFRFVKDSSVQALLTDASRRPEAVNDPHFWAALGHALSNAQAYPLALAAQEMSTKLAPDNSVFRADYAAILGASGKLEEALDILLDLPNETGVFSVLIGNQLSELGRKSEAISHYERAIEHDPEFSFSYVQLLIALEETGSPLYEYWLERARRKFPKSPWINRAYCHWLIKENRLEDLAEAHWVDDLEYVPDPRLMGRGIGGPWMIVEIQVLRSIARTVANEEILPLENAIKVLEAADRNWHLCVPAELVALVARLFGRRDLVWKASRRFCKACASGRLGTVTLQALLAHAAVAAGDCETAVKDAEIGLKESHDDIALRDVYWWALDEVGRSEEALKIAKELQKDLPDKPALCYNIAYIAGKLGQQATAIRFYEQEIAKHPDCALAYENLAPLKLMQGDVLAAKHLAEYWKVRAPEYLSPELVAAKYAKFRQLAAFVEATPDIRSLALDVCQLNEASDPFFGAKIKIPERRRTREEIVAALMGSDSDEREEVSFHLAMEGRGDHSILVARLERELPWLRKLPNEAFISLLEAEYQLDETSRADFAPCCMTFCKALEISLRKLLFSEFRTHVCALRTFHEIIAQASKSEFGRAGPLTRFVAKEASLELGKMALILDLFRNQTWNEMRLMAIFWDWLKGYGYGPLLDQIATDQIAILARRFRNPAAHAETFTRDQAAEAKRLTFECLRRMRPSDGPHR